MSGASARARCGGGSLAPRALGLLAWRAAAPRSCSACGQLCDWIASWLTASRRHARAAHGTPCDHALKRRAQVREVRDTAPELSERAALRALELCGGREDDAILRLSEEPPFKRRCMADAGDTAGARGAGVLCRSSGGPAGVWPRNPAVRQCSTQRQQHLARLCALRSAPRRAPAGGR